MYNPKLVITGTSCMSSLGIDSDALAANITENPVLDQVKDFPFHTLDTSLPCFRVKNFTPKEILGKKGLRTKDLATKFLLATMEIGLADRFTDENKAARPGLVIGTSFGSIQSIGDFLSDSIVNGVNSVNPMLFANTVINSPTGNANIRYGVKALSTTISTGFNSGIDAIIYACDFIRMGYFPVLIAGGLEEISYYMLIGAERSGFLSKTNSMKPFALDADGAIMGEGCGLFCIENEAHAKAEGAKITAEIVAYCRNFNPYTKQKKNESNLEAAQYTIEQAMRLAHIDKSALSFVASGANGYAYSDKLEAAVIASLLGDIPVTAYKTKTGECYGASGALSLACALADMRNNRITGIGSSYEVMNNLNVVTADKENMESEYILLTSFSSDGYCSSLIIKSVG